MHRFLQFFPSLEKQLTAGGEPESGVEHEHIVYTARAASNCLLTYHFLSTSAHYDARINIDKTRFKIHFV